jgi:hypothetical protein
VASRADRRSERYPPVRPRAGSPRRHAFCPLCGQARTETFASEVRTVDDALCPGRCTTGWQALTMLRLRESGSEQVAARRRDEYEAQRPHLMALSELLLLRWRAGDWGVDPAQLLEQIRSD